MSTVLERVAEVKVITRPACQPCKATLRRLGDREVTIIDSSVDTDEALALAASLGYAAAPIVVVYAEDGSIVDHWTGFDPARIDALLGAN